MTGSLWSEDWSGDGETAGTAGQGTTGGPWKRSNGVLRLHQLIGRRAAEITGTAHYTSWGPLGWLGAGAGAGAAGAGAGAV